LTTRVAGDLDCNSRTGSVEMDADERARRRAAQNKTRNATQKVKGQLKEAAGRVTGDERLEAEGRSDKTRANLKQAGEKVKDAFRGR
jgi:uncharacterized protein YjbJ (UPF0337 family)